MEVACLPASAFLASACAAACVKSALMVQARPRKASRLGCMAANGREKGELVRGCELKVIGLWHVIRVNDW